MNYVTVMGLVLALAFGSMAASAAAQSLADRPALVFTDAEGAFARSVTARYDGAASADVLADLRSQDFSCANDESYCTRTTMDGACVDAWSVDIAADQSVSGRHTRQCMGGEEE